MKLNYALALILTLLLFNSCKKEPQIDKSETNALTTKSNFKANTEQEQYYFNLFNMLPEVQYQWDHPMLLDREGNPGINFVEIYETFGISEFDNTIFRFFIAEKDDIEKERLNIEEGDVVVFSSFGNYFKYDYIIKGGGKNLSIQNGVYVGQKSSQFEIFLQQIYEFQAALEFFMNYTQTSGSYSASDYDLSAALGNNISVNVQAPYPPDTLHKVDIKDS